MTCQGPVFSMGGGGGEGGVKDFWDITLFSGGTERRGWGGGSQSYLIEHKVELYKIYC